MSDEYIKPIAFYLPQYHPIPENDEWWGKGFTEWTNVTKAKPLFKGHYQPFLPADLGFYDLRVPETRIEQAELAKEAGIYGFAYWHYWFGNGRRILERPLNEVLQSKMPDFPFCIAWANETWSGRWHGAENKTLIEQVYPGDNDIKDFFYDSLKYFNDDRYIRINGYPLMIIYKPNNLPDSNKFTDIWRMLANQNGLGNIYFIGISDDDKILGKGFDAFMKSSPNISFNLRNMLMNHNFFQKVLHISKIIGPEIYEYSDYIENIRKMQNGEYEYPVVLTNWDNSPRANKNSLILINSNPELYGKHLDDAINKVKNKKNKLIFIKSWNEWAEGNTLEPSQKWGKSYLNITKKYL